MARGSAPGERRGGRKKGVPNKTTATTRERIEREADPIGFLIRIQKGESIKANLLPGMEGPEQVVPSLEQRIAAANTLARKVVADMKAVEHSGEMGLNVGLKSFLEGLPE